MTIRESRRRKLLPLPEQGANSTLDPRPPLQDGTDRGVWWSARVWGRWLQRATKHSLANTRRSLEALAAGVWNGAGAPFRLGGRIVTVVRHRARKYAPELMTASAALVGWGLMTWAVVDAVPARWESVVWKASGGLLLATLTGRELWREIGRFGLYVLTRDEDGRSR